MASEIVLFESQDGEVQLTVSIENKTVWLSQEQMSLLFGRSVPVISRHIGNALREGEICKESNLQIMQKSRSEGATTLYDLDVVISVGYRVNSTRATRFRQWATKILNEYIRKDHWLHDLEVTEKWLSRPDLPRFTL